MEMIILRGPPGSGKSTYRAERMTGEDREQWRAINYDTLRLLAPDMKEREIVATCDRYCENYLRDGLNVVIDNTNMRMSTVNKWKKMGEAHNYNVTIKEFFDVDFYTCVRRDKIRGEKGGRSVGKSVIYKMFVDGGLWKPQGETNDIVLIDLDGTLCDIKHRVHHVKDLAEGQKKDWPAFFAGIKDDKVNDAVARLYQQIEFYHSEFYGYSGVGFMSGRGEEYRGETEKWLHSNGFLNYEFLLMRHFQDRREDQIIKQELYRKYVKPFWNVTFTVDDRPRVCRMWRDEGLTCMQINEEEF